MENENEILEVTQSGENEIVEVKQSGELDVIRQAKLPGDVVLTEQEKNEVSNYAQTIDLMDKTAIVRYGANSQEEVKQFSEQALANIKTKDLGEAGKLLTNLLGEIKGFDPSENGKKGIFGFAKKGIGQIKWMIARFDSVKNNIDKIQKALEGKQFALLKDIEMLQKLYDLNMQQYRKVTMYIFAGRERLNDVIENELPKLQAQAEETGSVEDAQKLRVLSNACIQFDKKLYDLELTRAICLQSAPQIQMMQENDSNLASQIQSSIMTTITAWEKQMLMAASLVNAKETVKLQKNVTDTTNELIRKNAEMLETNSVEIATESERGIVDVETLQYSTESLIRTIQSVIEIHQNGVMQRRSAEEQLYKLETEMAEKLRQIGSGKPAPAGELKPAGTITLE